MNHENNTLIGRELTTLTSCCSYVQIGDLNDIQNRDLDHYIEYILVERETRAITSSKCTMLDN